MACLAYTKTQVICLLRQHVQPDLAYTLMLVVVTCRIRPRNSAAGSLVHPSISETPDLSSRFERTTSLHLSLLPSSLDSGAGLGILSMAMSIWMSKLGR